MLGPRPVKNATSQLSRNCRRQWTEAPAPCQLPTPQLSRNCRSKRTGASEDFTGLPVEQLEAERGGTLPDLAETTRPLLEIVGVGTGIAIDEFAFEGVVDEDGELTRGGRNGDR